jgi:hypothetical protein
MKNEKEMHVVVKYMFSQLVLLSILFLIFILSGEIRRRVYKYLLAKFHLSGNIPKSDFKISFQLSLPLNISCREIDTVIRLYYTDRGWTFSQNGNRYCGFNNPWATCEIMLILTPEESHNSIVVNQDYYDASMQWGPRIMRVMKFQKLKLNIYRKHIEKMHIDFESFIYKRVIGHSLYAEQSSMLLAE